MGKPGLREMRCAECHWRSSSFGCVEAFCLLKGKAVEEFGPACDDFREAIGAEQGEGKRFREAGGGAGHQTHPSVSQKRLGG